MAKPRAEPKSEAGESLTSRNFLPESCEFSVGTQSIFATNSTLGVRMQAQLAVVPLSQVASMGGQGNNRQGTRHDLEEIALRIRAASR